MEKPLTRDALVSMQVIDAQGHLVGKVKDVAFAIGKTGIALTVANKEGEERNIPWEDIQAASDFIILKPQQTAQTTYQPQQAQQQQVAAQPTQPVQKQQQSNQPLCPTCNRPLTWIPQYQRWYCYNDKKYV